MWDGENALLHGDANRNTVLHFTDLPGDWGGPTSLRNLRANSSLFYAYDMSGDVRAMLDATGTVTDTFDYMAFGDPAGGTQTTNFTLLRYRYKGRYGYYWSQNSVYYVRARWLHTDIYRAPWFSRDSLGFDGGDWNLYRYVENNPVTNVDPNGQASASYNGIATCFNDKKLFCTSNPDYKQCPTFNHGMTGAVPNVYYDWRKLKCRCPFHRTIAYQSSLYSGYVECGSTVTISKGQCSISIKIIDAGPRGHLPSHASVDLSEKAYAALFKCLSHNKKKVPTCGESDPIKGVLVSVNVDQVS